eukprot:365844-Chlamydomonas_euryale.AAC.11
MSGAPGRCAALLCWQAQDSLRTSGRLCALPRGLRVGNAEQGGRAEPASFLLRAFGFPLKAYAAC